MTDMRLHRRAREWYVATVVTDPALTSWEASFDYGATWHTGEPVPGQPTEWRWLIAGPEAVTGDAVAVTPATLIPDIRAIDNPEIVVREAPRIVLYGTRTGTAQAPVTSVTSARLVSYDPADSGLDADNVQAAVDALADQTEVARARGRWPVVQIDTGGVAIADTVTYVPGTYTITDTDGGIVHSGSLNIRGRGNSTWGLPKKPYRLNLGAKTRLLGMTAEAKNWNLLANHYDKAKVGNALAMDLGRGMSGLAWTPQYRMVELVLNGDYLGIYQLCDPVRLDTDRVAGSAVSGDTGDGLTGTYLMEVSRKDRDAAVAGFDTTLGAGIIWDDPSAPTGPQSAYITAYVQAFEDALFGEDFTDPTTGWRAYADETSFADWYLIEEFLANTDSQMWSSCKIYKPRDSVGGGKLHMGPLWDFDLSAGLAWNPGDTSVSANAPATGFYTQAGGGFWFSRLWRDPTFRATLQTRWPLLTTRLASLADGYPEWIDRLIDAQTPAIGRDDRRWSTVTYTPYHADYRKRWLADRLAWFGAQIASAVESPAPGAVGGNVWPPIEELTTNGLHAYTEPYWGATLSVDPADKHSGTQSYKVTVPDAAHPYGMIFRSNIIVPKDPTHQYQGRAWVKGPAGTVAAISCRVYDKSNGYIAEGVSLQSFTFTGAWQQVETGLFQFGPDDHLVVGGWRPAIQIVSTFPAAGEFRVDDIEIVRTA